MNRLSFRGLRERNPVGSAPSTALRAHGIEGCDVHREADNSSGADPLQSEHFYSTLKRLAATVRLCMPPHESHAYGVRESITQIP